MSNAVLKRIENELKAAEISHLPSGDSDSNVEFSALVAHDVIQSQVLVISQEVALFRRYVKELMEQTLNNNVKYLTKTILPPDEMELELKKATKMLMGLGKEIGVDKTNIYDGYVRTY